MYQSRLNQGEILAEQIKTNYPDLEIDAVIPIPDSGRIAAFNWPNLWAFRTEKVS